MKKLYTITLLSCLSIGLISTKCFEFETLNILSGVEIKPVSPGAVDLQARVIDATGLITNHGFVFSEFPNPELNSSSSSVLELDTLQIETDFAVPVTNLSLERRYFFRAFMVINDDLDNVVYGAQADIFTEPDFKADESINMAGVSNITSTTATLGGEIEISLDNSSVLAYGHCLDTVGHKGKLPEYSLIACNDSLIPVEAARDCGGALNLANSELFSFTNQLNNLKPGTTYYVRAFAFTTRQDSLNQGAILSIIETGSCSCFTTPAE